MVNVDTTGIPPRLLPSGDRAVLAEYPDGRAVLAAFAALDATRLDGVVDIVPAARTILVTFDRSRTSLQRVRSWLAATRPIEDDRATAEDVEIGVLYDGDDLAGLADLLAVSVEALVARHQAAGWTVAFTGFAPGFGYLVSDDWPFEVPRLASPRTAVPQGAVGLAAGYCGVYPRSTPGGWQLIGTADAVLFDAHRDTPALLHPGARVRFTETS